MVLCAALALVAGREVEVLVEFQRPTRVPTAPSKK
jgi:hypothetical protein